MAKRSKPKESKTAAIRAALKTQSSPKEVAKKLASRGVKVTPAYVSVIKAADKRKAGGKRGAKKANTADGTDAQQAKELMGHALALVLAVGPEQSREFISAAAELADQFNS